MERSQVVDGGGGLGLGLGLGLRPPTHCSLNWAIAARSRSRVIDRRVAMASDGVVVCTG